MPKIIFNYKVCDMSPECGGIEVCPKNAIYYDIKLKKPVWDESKCNFCLQCTLPGTCPVGAILFARDQQQADLINETINKDPRTQDDLWQERYGVEPSINSPKAENITSDPKSIFSQNEIIIIDIWHPEFLECRLHSPLFSKLLLNFPQKFKLYKLNASKYPQYANKLNVKDFPSLLIYKNSVLIDSIQGYIKIADIDKINQRLIKKVKNFK